MSQTRRRLRDYRINLQNPALCVTLKTAGEISPKSMASVKQGNQLAI